MTSQPIRRALRRILHIAGDLRSFLGPALPRWSSRQPAARQHSSDGKYSQGHRWDLFIAHAWEDKETFVRPLALGLAKEGLSVWYDEFSLRVGDSLRRKIDEGLRESRFGIVVLSPHFFAKEWPQKELDALVSLETTTRKVILPIWHRLSTEEIRNFSPLMAGRIAINSAQPLKQIIGQIASEVAAATLNRAPSIQTGMLSIVRFVDLLTRDDYLETSELDSFPDEFLGQFVCDRLQEGRLRARVVELLFKRNAVSETLLVQFVSDYHEHVRFTIARSIGEYLRPISRSSLQRLMQDEKADIASETLESAFILAKKGYYMSDVFSASHGHRSWEVRYKAMAKIIFMDDELSVRALYLFADTTYHLARNHVRKYFEQRFLNGQLAGEDLQVARELLRRYATDGKSSDTTVKKVKDTLACLGG